MMRFHPTHPLSVAQPGLVRKGALLSRMAQALASKQMSVLALVIAMIIVLLASLGPLTSNRFHRDEAIYSSWGLDIASGRDLLVSASPVDKPPLFLYVQALSFLFLGPTEAAARLPSLAASVVNVWLIYALGNSLYGRGVAWVTAFLLAASPFTILFAPTAFTDPMMVTWVLAGCLAAVRGYWGLAGVLLGLASITKQQGVFFVPLALGLGQRPHLRSHIGRFALTFLAMLGLAFGWDLARARRPGFLPQSLVSYGHITLSPAGVWEHLSGFVSLLRYATGSRVLNTALLIGLPVLLVMDILSTLGRPRTFLSQSGEPGATGPARSDLVLSVFVFLFLAGHLLFSFLVWDRYLLGLIPVLALLLARVLTLPRRLLKDAPLADLFCRLLVVCALLLTFQPMRDAAASRFPIGGDHGAYQGIQQVVDYFQTVPADTTLYHRWLGWHWRFYLWGSPYAMHLWTSPADLAAQAAARPGARRYVVFPSWRSSTEARLALADAGLTMREVQRAFRDDGTVSFSVYRIEETP